MRFAKEKPVPVTGFRFCNIYGPGEEKKGKRMSMIGQLIDQMKNDVPLTLFKDGEQRRDWVHVNDVVQAITLAMDQSSMNHGEIYNLGSGASYTFNEVAQTVHEEYCDKLSFDKYGKKWSVKKEMKINYIDCPFADKYQSYTECDIEKARRELGYSPSFDLRSGVRQYVETF